MVKSVASSCDSEMPAIFDCVKSGYNRAFGNLFGGPLPSHQLVPFWFIDLLEIDCEILQALVADDDAAWLHAFSDCERVAYTHQINGAQVHGWVCGVDCLTLTQNPNRSRSPFDAFYPQLMATFASAFIADAILYPVDPLPKLA